MTLRWSLLPGVVLLAGIVAAQDAPRLESQKEKQSYALGVNLGKGVQKGLQKQALDLDPALVSQGLKDVLSGGRMRMPEAQSREIMEVLQADLKNRQAAGRSEKMLKNKREGDAFLAENRAKEGVVALESGLQYKVLKTGDGQKPMANDTVVCHYRGTYIDGTEFANSYKGAKPLTFPVDKVIKGWREALPLMWTGSRWLLFVPSQLAYGPRGSGKIGPNATLIFEIELISVKDPAAPEERVKSAVAASSPSAINVSFKLDSRLLGPTYGGERWVSPPTYVGASAQDTVETRAEAIDAQGRSLKTTSKWTASDPAMVTVSPDEGNNVKITVKRPGESRVEVASAGISKTLTVKAKQQANAIQVEISQK